MNVRYLTAYSLIPYENSRIERETFFHLKNDNKISKIDRLGTKKWLNYKISVVSQLSSINWGRGNWSTARSSFH